MPKTWRINKKARNWECDWAGDADFHLRHFRALPMEEKIKAVEKMCALAGQLKEQHGEYRVKRKRNPAG